jgi:hypothetical protein
MVWQRILSQGCSIALQGAINRNAEDGSNTGTEGSITTTSLVQTALDHRKGVIDHSYRTGTCRDERELEQKD